MTKNFIPYSRQSINNEDISSVIKVLKSDLITQGPLVDLFEKKVTEIVKAKYGVSTNSATSALHIACLALGLSKGDYVWTSPITFVASANCAKYCQAEVDFVDIDQNTGLISINKLENKLKYAKKRGKLPKILIPVHLTGSSCEMKAIKSLSEKYKFFVIEDASHAIGGKYEKEPVGSCKYSDITVFSFHPVKIVTSGEGGIATTNKESIFTKMKELRSHGITKEYSKFTKLSKDPWVYEQQNLGFNYRITDICAALGLSQLNRLEEIVIERNKQHHIYEKLFFNTSIKLLKKPENVYSSFHLQVIQLEDKDKYKYKKLFYGMRELGIGVQLHYFPVHLQPYYQNMGFKEGMFPSSENYSSRSISIPLFPGLQKKQQHFIKDSILELLR